MNEVTLYGELRKLMKTSMPNRYVSFKTNDRSTSGIPDMVLIGNRITSWWEFKYADPEFDWEGIQHLTACRLNRESYCRYVIFQESARSIHVVQPHLILEWIQDNRTRLVADIVIGSTERDTFNYEGLIDYMRKLHNL